MFDSYYPITVLHHRAVTGRKYQIAEYKFKFRTELRRVYLIEVEQYEANIYIVKFYPQRFENRSDKYNLVLNDGLPSAVRIIRSCVEAMLWIFQKDANASFGFIGSTKILKNGVEESRNNTQCFRIYSRVIAYRFGSRQFSHFQNIKNSAYLMVNTNHNDSQSIAEKGVKMFAEIYEDLEF